MPWSVKILSGLPRLSMSVVSSRATRVPEIEVPGIAARNSRVTSLMTLRTWKLPPKGTGQHEIHRPAGIGLRATRICARVPTACRRAFRLRTESHFLAIQPVDSPGVLRPAGGGRTGANSRNDAAHWRGHTVSSEFGAIPLTKPWVAKAELG